MLIIWFSLLLLVSVIMLVSILVNKKAVTDREKGSPFECGFDPQNSSRVPFSIRFFVVTLIFLIFDVEISLLLPFVFLSTTSFSSLLVISFSFILLLGVFYEWKEGALSWIN